MIKRVLVDTQKLKLEIKKSDYTGKDIVELTGLKTHDLYNCLNGNGIKRDKLQLICDKLGKKPEDFIEDDNGWTQQEAKIKEENKIPYNPELHKLSLDLLQEIILREGMEVDFALVKEIHDKIYNIIIKRENFNKNLIEGVAISVLDNYI